MKKIPMKKIPMNKKYMNMTEVPKRSELAKKRKKNEKR